VFDPLGNFLFQFQAYANTVNGGLSIAAGNIENVHSGTFELNDIVTVPSRGVSDVKVWHNQFTTTHATPVTLFREFFPWGKSFIGGSTIAVADLNLDGRGDVIVGSGPGMQPLVEAFNVTVAAPSYTPFKTFFPFASTFRGGVNVSAISAGQGVAAPQVIISQGSGGSSIVRMYNGATGALSNLFIPYTGNGSNAPVRTAPKVIGGHLFVYTAQLTDGRSTTIREFDPTNGAIVDYIFENDPNFLGVYLG
jgi:serralysin